MRATQHQSSQTPRQPRPIRAPRWCPSYQHTCMRCRRILPSFYVGSLCIACRTIQARPPQTPPAGPSAPSMAPAKRGSWSATARSNPKQPASIISPWGTAS